MKLIKVFLLLLLCSVAIAQSNGKEFIKVNSVKEWGNILSEAKSGQKKVLLYFSGSDWCGKCNLLKNRVLNKEEFKQFTKSHLVFVNIDFPQKQPDISTDEKKAKEFLADKFNSEGIFPRLVLIDENGNKTSDIKGYRGQSFSEIINRLKQ